MAQINVNGYVTQDIILKQSRGGNAYAHFVLKEYISKSRYQTYQVWIWENTLPKLKRFKIKKGSLIWITGSLELVDYSATDRQEKIQILKINCSDLGVIRVNLAENAAAESRPAESTPNSLPEELDGDRNQLPE